MSAFASPRVLVVDDNAIFVESLVDALGAKGLAVEGCEPERLLNWCKKADFFFDLVLLDMRLGLSPSGQALNAAKVLPRLQTYARATKVVVFSQDDISPSESVRCLELGALAVVSKTLGIEDLVSLVAAYPSIRNQSEAIEKLIRILWHSLLAPAADVPKGEYMEMFAINLFNSMPGFRVIGQNIRTVAGEIDVIVENINTHPFWTALNSLHLVIECKNQTPNIELTILNQLRDLVEARSPLARVGVVATISDPTSGLRARQQQLLEAHGVHLFVLSKVELARLVELSAFEREPFLRDVFGRQ